LIIFWKKLGQMYAFCGGRPMFWKMENFLRKNEFCSFFFFFALLVFFFSGLRILEQNSSGESCRQSSCCSVSLILEKRRFGGVFIN
jgi:hypothetical protein